MGQFARVRVRVRVRLWVRLWVRVRVRVRVRVCPADPYPLPAPTDPIVRAVGPPP